jgi:ribosomal protein L16 Arg81 hydroxylase
MDSGGKQANSNMLASILRPVQIKTFLDEYFGKKPLLVRGAPGKFDSLMKPRDFIYRLDRVPEIRCVFDQLRQATIGPADIREMFEAGATICVTGIDCAHRSLRIAGRKIRKEIGYAGRVDFRAYLSPPGSGFDFHYDARVATTLQFEGTKTWWYSEEPDLPLPIENSSRADMTAIRLAVSKIKLRRVTLRPGDLLCLPPGVWHKARAGTGGSFALNMAFNHVGATVLDVILEELRASLSSEPGCREPFFTGPPEDLMKPVHGHVHECIDALQRVLPGLRGTLALRKLEQSAMRRHAVAS